MLVNNLILVFTVWLFARYVIGTDQTSWKIKDTGIVICPDCTSIGTPVTCHVSCHHVTPLDFGETLVSRIVSIDVSMANDFAIIIPHSGPYRCKEHCYYEIMVKEYSHDTKNWKDVDVRTFENVEKLIKTPSSYGECNILRVLKYILSILF